MNCMIEEKQTNRYIELAGLSKVFHTAAGDFIALKDLEVCFCQGEFTSVVGRSGSGKSTLMNMITGIDHPSSGEVLVESQKIHQFNETRMARWRGKNLGIVFQFYQLLPVFTLLENVMLPMQIAQKYTSDERRLRALNLLEQVGLEDFVEQYPNLVSGGQQQSAAIARALANDPPILIADEPTGNLGSTEAAKVIEIFHELSMQGKTIIMVTHDLDLAKNAQRILTLADGRLVNDQRNTYQKNLPNMSANTQRISKQEK
jgi:putative ABC transport system ATP-binding protein